MEHELAHHYRQKWFDLARLTVYTGYMELAFLVTHELKREQWEKKKGSDSVIITWEKGWTIKDETWTNTEQKSKWTIHEKKRV